MWLTSSRLILVPRVRRKQKEWFTKKKIFADYFHSICMTFYYMGLGRVCDL